MKKDRTVIVTAIKLAWDSLESHLPFCEEVKPKERELRGDEKFHRKAVQDYATIIKTLADQL